MLEHLFIIRSRSLINPVLVVVTSLTLLLINNNSSASLPGTLYKINPANVPSLNISKDRVFVRFLVLFCDIQRSYSFWRCQTKPGAKWKISSLLVLVTSGALSPCLLRSLNFLPPEKHGFTGCFEKKKNSRSPCPIRVTLLGSRDTNKVYWCHWFLRIIFSLSYITNIE